VPSVRLLGGWELSWLNWDWAGCLGTKVGVPVPKNAFLAGKRVAGLTVAYG
jgi:hypothetical protein